MNISNLIMERGYLITTATSIEDYKNLCQAIGTPKQYADVHIDPSKKEYKYSSDSIPFHTDNPTMDILGFYSVFPENDGGDNLLLDSRPLLNQLTPEERKALINYSMKLPNSCGTLHPLLNEQENHIFYLPFFWQKEINTFLSSGNTEINATPLTYQAMAKFHTLVEKAFSTKSYITISLKIGDVLFLNNKIFLHGRQSIPRNSKRYLVRSLIQHYY